MDSFELRDKVKFYEHLTEKHNLFSPDVKPISQKAVLSSPDQLQKYWTAYLMDRHDPYVSLYIHVPFCKRKKCKYCMYRSKKSCSHAELERYLKYLDAEMEGFRPVFSGRPFTTVHIGGGTPTILSAGQLRRLMTMVKDRFFVRDARSYCLEVKPTLYDAAQLETAAELGCNRVSIGIQSMNPQAMKMANRDFADIQSLKCLIESLFEIGIYEINADLIGGLPGDTPEGFRDSFQQIAGLGVSTITVYFFRLENSRYSNAVKKEYIDYSRHGYTLLFLDALSGIIKESGYSRITNNPYSQNQEFIRNDFLGKRLEKHLTDWTVQRRNSCLGIGIGARSFIGNAVNFINIGPHGLAVSDISVALESEFDYPSTKYLTIKADKMAQMRDMTVKSLHYSGSISKKVFRGIFDKDIEEVFRYELQALLTLDKIAFEGDDVVMLCEGFDRAVHLKFFYDQDELIRTSKKGPSSKYISF